VIARDGRRRPQAPQCDPQAADDVGYTITDYRQDVATAALRWVVSQESALEQFETTITSSAEDSWFASAPSAVLQLFLQKRLKQFAGWVVGEDGLELLVDIGDDVYSEWTGRPREVELPEFLQDVRGRIQDYSAAIDDKALSAERRARDSRDAYPAGPDGERCFLAELRTAALQTLAEQPSSKDIELALYSAWVQGQRGGFMRASGRLTVAYRASLDQGDLTYRLQRAQIEEAEGHEQINSRINELHGDRGPIDLNTLQVRKYVTFESADGGVTAYVVLDAANNVHEASTSSEVAGRITSGDGLALWDSVAPGRRLPTVDELGPQGGDA
jgi:hypothetical protein